MYGFSSNKFAITLYILCNTPRNVIQKQLHMCLQSERTENGEKGRIKLNRQRGTYTRKTYRKRSEQLFPSRWPRSYPNLTNNMKTRIRCKQPKNKHQDKKKKKKKNNKNNKNHNKSIALQRSNRSTLKKSYKRPPHILSSSSESKIRSIKIHDHMDKPMSNSGSVSFCIPKCVILLTQTKHV